MRCSLEWTEEDMYPYSRVEVEYEDTENLTVWDYWKEDYYREEYEREN